MVLALKTPFRESLPRERSECFGHGTTHVVMSPLELLQRLAALVPRPRLNLIRFHGILAPNAKWRSQVVPRQLSTANDGEEVRKGEVEINDAQRQEQGRYVSWARLLKRVFNLDMECCPNCGGQLKVIAAIEDPIVIRKILAHLGLSPHPPPRAPARYDPYDEADLYSTT